MSRRVCFALDLVADADLIADYEAAHAPGRVWPEVTAGIRAVGYESMEIWRAGDRLFMVAEVADDWPRPLSPAAEAIDARWQAAMDGFQRRLPCASAGEKWVRMTRIYALEDQ